MILTLKVMAKCFNDIILDYWAPQQSSEIDISSKEISIVTFKLVAHDRAIILLWSGTIFLITLIIKSFRLRGYDPVNVYHQHLGCTFQKFQFKVSIIFH